MAWNDRIDPFTRLPSKHDGIDLPFGENAPLGAMRGGVVKNIANDPKGYGWFADILHDDGTTGRYAHANVITKGVGQRIENGEELGLVGSTGRSTGAHLHFEHHNQLGKPIDPNPLVASSGAPFPSSNIGGPKMGAALPQSLSSFDQIMAQAQANNVAPKVSQELIDSLSRVNQQKSANLPLALGALLSGDKQISALGNTMYKDANDARGLIPLGEEGFVDPETGQFHVSPVATDKRQQRTLELSLRQASENERKQAAVTQAGIQMETSNQFKTLMLQGQQQGRAIAQQNADTNKLRADDAKVAADEKARLLALGKPVPFNQLAELSGNGGLVDTLGGLSRNFKDDFGGAGIDAIGNVQNAVGRNVGGGYEQQGNWWQQYNDHANIMRNKLFGAAVTAPELAAFNAANISPGMRPDVIKTRLAQQEAAAASAYNKLIAHGKAGGYNMGDFEPKGVNANNYIGGAPSGAQANPGYGSPVPGAPQLSTAPSAPGAAPAQGWSNFRSGGK